MQLYKSIMVFQENNKLIWKTKFRNSSLEYK